MARVTSAFWWTVQPGKELDFIEAARLRDELFALEARKKEKQYINPC